MALRERWRAALGSRNWDEAAGLLSRVEQSCPEELLERDANGRSALELACESVGDSALDMAFRLCEALDARFLTTRVEECQEILNRSLMSAARFKDSPDLIQLLASSGALPSHQGAEGATALHWAFESGHFSSAAALLQAGARMDIPDALGRLPGEGMGLFGLSDAAGFDHGAHQARPPAGEAFFEGDRLEGERGMEMAKAALARAGSSREELESISEGAVAESNELFGRLARKLALRRGDSNGSAEPQSGPKPGA